MRSSQATPTRPPPRPILLRGAGGGTPLPGWTPGLVQKPSSWRVSHPVSTWSGAVLLSRGMGPRQAPPAVPVDQSQQQVTHTGPGSPSLQGEENSVTLSSGRSHLPGSLGEKCPHCLPISTCPWNQHLFIGTVRHVSSSPFHRARESHLGG